MKKIFVAIVLIVLMAGAALATPFLVSDPPVAGSTIPTFYKLTGPAWVPASVPAMADGTIRVDVVSSLIGENAITVAPCINDPVWGEKCASPFPYTFNQPAPPVSTSGMRLTQ